MDAIYRQVSLAYLLTEYYFVENTIKMTNLHFEQGRQARKQGQNEEAIRCFRLALEQTPDHIPSYNNLANALQQQGEHSEALALYQQALQYAPNMAVLHCNQASLQQLQGELELAIQGFQQALQLKPDFALAQQNLAKAYSANAQFALAEQAFLRAIQLQPDDADIYFELGQLYQRYGFIPKATDCYRHSLRLKPSAPAYNALGAAFQDWGNTDFALKCFARAEKIDPEFSLSLYNRAQIAERTDLAQALNYYQQALALDPDNARLHCHIAAIRGLQADWEDYDARMADLIRRLQDHLSEANSAPLPTMSLLAMPLPNELFLAIAKKTAAHFAELAKALPFAAKPCPAPAPRLKIGYVSPDLRCHAVGTLIAELFQHHDRNAFDIYAYSLTPSRDEWTEKIRQGCEHFLDISLMPAAEIAQHIQNDGIHILIDLAGYTSFSRTLIFALKPAPIQIQYLGYPGTLGADFIPYLITDNSLIPDELAAYYSEQRILLPHAWCAAPMPVADIQLTRSECGLPEHGVVYCCLNRHYKIEPRVFKDWMTILKQVPDSVLWLSSHQDSNARLQQTAEQQGVDPKRLVFAESRPHAEYLAYYRLADLFLDTYTYNAGATAMGALSTGLPLLTCLGQHYASRMGASLCHAVGFPEWISDSPAQYVQRAIELGQQPEQLAELKQHLQQALSQAPLFQPQIWINNLEQQLQQLWQQHQPTGEPS